MRKHLTATAMALALAAPGLAFAQDDGSAGTTGLMTTTPYDSRDSMNPGGLPGQALPDRPGDERVWGMTGNDIVGQTLYGAEGEEIGQVQDVVGRAGATRAEAVVSVGGFLGIGDREVALPLDRVQMEGDRLTTDLTRAEIEGMQAYDQSGGYQAWDRGTRLGMDQP